MKSIAIFSLVAGLFTVTSACAAINRDPSATSKTTTTAPGTTVTTTATGDSTSTKVSTSKGGFVEDRYTLKVKGMTCGGCEESIKKTVSAVPGVASVVADHKTGTVKIVSSGPSALDKQKVIQAIESAGDYKVQK